MSGQRRRRALLVFLTVFTLLLAAVNAYIGLRLLPALQVGTGAGIAWLIVATLLVPAGLLTPLLARALSPRAVSILAWSGLLMAGLTSTLFLLTLARDLLLFVTGLAMDSTALATYVEPSAWIVAGLALALTVIGFLNARRTPQVVTVDVPLAELPAALEGFRIVQITDVHVGPTIRRDFLARVVARVNTLDAHVVAITGDLVDGSVAALGEHVAPLRDLRARHGSYFVTGNHEFYSGVDNWMRELQRLGIKVLHNAHAHIDHDGGPLVLGGISDYSGHLFGEAHRSDPQRALAGAHTEATKVLLAHQPRSASMAAAAGFHLQISGHTHGGQFLPWNFLVPLQQPFTAGLHRQGDMWIYVSRGTGYWGPPKRLGAPSEITLIRLVRAPPTAPTGTPPPSR